MKLRLLLLTFVLTLVSRPRALHAQDQDFKFQPPKPPPLDVDFDDDDDEEFGDDMGRPPVPAGPNVITPGSAPGRIDPAAPPPPAGGAPAFGGAAGGAGGDFGSSSVSAGKFRFKVVDGEYWEKGKKRTRGRETHVDGSQDSRGGGGGH